MLDSSEPKNSYDFSMGHDVIAYTADLYIRFRKSMKIYTRNFLKTRIVSNHRDTLFSLECQIIQNNHLAVEATGRFFKKHTDHKAKP